MLLKLCITLLCVCVGFIGAHKWEEPTTEAEFDKEIRDAGDKLAVVVFHAIWCGYSRKVMPAVDNLAENYGPQIVVIKVDEHLSKKLKTRFHIEGYPTAVFMRNGTELDREEGVDEDVLNKRTGELIPIQNSTMIPPTTDAKNTMYSASTIFSGLLQYINKYY